MAVNYDDVLSQLQSVGLIVDRIEPGKIRRVKVEGDREKRGWYSVHEITLDNGDQALIGSYGVWHGDDNGAIKIELKKTPLSDTQKAAIKARLAEDAKRAKAIKAAEQTAAAERATLKWQTLTASGDHDYLTRKGITAHGVRFGGPGATIEGETDEGKHWATSAEGALFIPVTDAQARTHGLQVIWSRKLHAERIKRIESDKEFWPRGLAKQGHFHLIGLPSWLLVIAEGYATASSIHEATGLPVAVAFDAGNLLPVAQALHKRYPRVKILIAADHDQFGKCRECRAPVHLKTDPQKCPTCGADHRADNAGVTRASAAALAVGGAWCRPQFPDDDALFARFLANTRDKITDYNDLHALQGLQAVRVQIETAIEAAGWKPPLARAAAAAPKTGGEGKQQLRPIETLDELLERYALVYGQGGKVFDFTERTLVELSDMRDLCISRELHRRWCEHPGRRIVRIEQVGFDPTEKDPAILCNTFGGWPYKPKEGDCELLLELLAYLCGAEDNADEVYHWLIQWLAYPLQHPGAKMQSAVVMHGAQGTGKSKFFGTICKLIYGQYGLVINQSAVENPRNTWLASRLFILAEEVVARQELHHVKNALKDLVTGDTVYVDPKFVNAYPERNHVNIVFLSNEGQPIVLEDDDRRHLVVWTPREAQPAGFYAQLQREIDAGGALALYHHLMNVDLTGFGPHTRPPMTKAKKHLIDISLDSTTRFFRHLTEGQIHGIKARPALSQDVFDLYRVWCNRLGIKPAPQPRLINALEKKHAVPNVRERYRFGPGDIKGPHGICMFGTEEPGPADDRREWLGRNIAAFREDVRNYRSEDDATA